MSNLEKNFYHICATTEAQREIFSTIRISPDATTAFNESITLTLTGDLDIQSLGIAIESVVNRHSTLKSVFSPDFLWMMTYEYLPVELDTLDDVISQNQLENTIAREVDFSFDLTQGPLIRFVLRRVENNSYRLIITTHHVVCDGWSWAVLLDELGRYYSELSHGELAFHPLPVQYWQYLKALSDRSAEINNHRQYWIELFKDNIPQLDLPLDFVRPRQRSFRSQRIDVAVPLDTVKEMRKLAGKLRISFYSLLYGCYLISLQRISGNDQLVVGISAAAQSYMGLKNLIGHCVNLLPIKSSVDSDLDFVSFIQQVAKNLLDGFDHQLFTFGSLLKELPLSRDPSRIPLVNVIFNIDLQPAGQGLHFDKLVSHFVTNPRSAENFEIFVNATVCEDQVVIETQYNCDLFTEQRIKNWTEGFIAICQQITVDSNKKIHEYQFDFLSTSAVDNSKIASYSHHEKDDVVDDEILNGVLLIAQDLLQVGNLTGVDNFFHHGGHSLLAAEFMIKLNDKFSGDLKLYDIFSAQNFNELVLILLEHDNTVGVENCRLIQQQKQERYELSLQQFRAWYVQTIYPQSTLYNLPSLYRFAIDVNIDLVIKAVNQFREKHELVRAKLQVEHQKPYWIVQDYVPITFSISKKYKNYQELFNYIQEDAYLPIDLYKDALFKVEFYQTADGHFYQYTKIHHLIWDGWSYDIFGDELALVYVHSDNWKQTTEFSYFDYVDWQQRFHASNIAKQQIHYWQDVLKGELPILQLPLDYSRPRNLDYIGDSIIIRWNEDEVQELENLAKKIDTTLFNVLLLGFYVLLEKYSQQQDIIIGIPVQGREQEGLKEIVGFFASNIPIRITGDRNSKIIDLLRQVSQQVAMGYSHAEVGFDEVVKVLNIDRSSSYTPVYQSFFMFQDSTNRQSAYDLLPFDNIPVARGACHTDLDFWARRDPRGMVGGLDFMTALFSRNTIERMASELKYLLSSLARNNTLPLEQIEVFTPESKLELLQDYNQTKVLLPVGIYTVDQLISRQVLEQGDKIAVRDLSGNKLSYQELELQSNKLANFLKEQGIREGHLIGVAMKRQSNLLIALLAIWKSGAGYVPLDPDFPDERLFYMTQHSGVNLIITNRELAQRSFMQSCDQIFIEDNYLWEKFSDQHLEIDYTKIETCYVIYTSGSTGKPKGVQLGHRSVINFLLSMAKKPGMTADDRLCAITTLSFDISVLELFLPLVVGGEVLVVSKDISLFGDKLSKVLEEYKISLMQATPASWRLLLHAKWQPSKNFKILCGGEPFPKDLALELVKGSDQVWNMYGPTETTVWSTCYQVRANDPIMYIGRPIDNTTIYILDANRKLVPWGGAGELYIGGLGLALGYLNNKEQTAERFVENPFVPGELIYNTGDLARYHHNGLLECLGRNDGQVKVRGYRIELGEIEAVIASIDEITAQVVIVREDRPGDVRLIAYYIADHEVPLEKFRTALAEKLPPYMIPAAFIHLDNFPMTLNHKIDRKKLPAPGAFSDSKGVVEQQVPTSSSLSVTEKKLLQKWQELLDQDNIKVDDNFFDIGGHSLLSVQLFSFIEEEFGKSLPLSTLFNYGSIRSLAKLISPESETISEKMEDKQVSAVLPTVKPHNLVQLRAGAGLPIVFFHGVGGNVLNYYSFFGFLDKQRPIYGLQSSGVDGKSPLVETFDKMVIEYSNELLQFLPQGNCDFIGGSMGGLLALAVANRLKEYGYKINKVILFDTFGPNFDPNRYCQSSLSWEERIKDSLRWRFSRYYYLGMYALLKLFSRPIPHAIRHHIVEQHNFNLLSNYKITHYIGDVILIRGRLEKCGRSADPKLGWEGIIQGDLSIYFTDSDHDTIIESLEAGRKLKEVLG